MEVQANPPVPLLLLLSGMVALALLLLVSIYEDFLLFLDSSTVLNNQHSAFSMVPKEAGNCVVLGREDEIDADGEGVSSTVNKPVQFQKKVYAKVLLQLLISKLFLSTPANSNCY